MECSAPPRRSERPPPRAARDPVTISSWTISLSAQSRARAQRDFRKSPRAGGTRRSWRRLMQVNKGGAGGGCGKHEQTRRTSPKRAVDVCTAPRSSRPHGDASVRPTKAVNRLGLGERCSRASRTITCARQTAGFRRNRRPRQAPEVGSVAGNRVLRHHTTMGTAHHHYTQRSAVQNRVYKRTSAPGAKAQHPSPAPRRNIINAAGSRAAGRTPSTTKNHTKREPAQARGLVSVANRSVGTQGAKSRRRAEHSGAPCRTRGIRRNQRIMAKS